MSVGIDANRLDRVALAKQGRKAQEEGICLIWHIIASSRCLITTFSSQFHTFHTLFIANTLNRLEKDPARWKLWRRDWQPWRDKWTTTASTNSCNARAVYTANSIPDQQCSIKRTSKSRRSKHTNQNGTTHCAKCRYQSQCSCKQTAKDYQESIYR